MDKNKKIIKITIFSGVSLSIFMLLIFGVFYSLCKGSPRLDCLFVLLFIPSPGIFIDNLLNLNLEGASLLSVAIFIWFLLGALIGFLIYKFKKAK